MKAEMSETGIITLSPETTAEAYALSCWASAAWVTAEDVKRHEVGHWRGSRLCVDAAFDAEELK